MRERPRAGQWAAPLIVALGLVASRQAAAQQAPATRPATGAPAGKAATAPAGKAATAAPASLPPVRPANFSQTVATVNGQPITRGDLVKFIAQFPPPAAGEEKEMYERAVDLLVNNKLLSQYLTKRRVVVTDKELADEIAAQERKMKAEDGRSLTTALAESGTTMDELKGQVLPVLAWRKYITEVGKDPALKKYVDENKDTFSRAQVRASHILILLPEDATPAVKEAAKAKLAGIKKEIESGKITFPDAANKYSEDDANKASPNGGDLGYFQRKGQFIEKFSAAAFAMKPQTISDPIETEFGVHLIQVTDRKAGQPFDFEQNKVAVLNTFSAESMEKIVEDERKTAKIDVKPMPTDLFPPAAATPPPGGPTVPATPPAGAVPKAATPR